MSKAVAGYSMKKLTTEEAKSQSQKAKLTTQELQSQRENQNAQFRGKEILPEVLLMP